MSQVGTGVWRFVGAFRAQSHVDCHPRWALSLPRHTRTATHRQPAHTDVLQEVAVQPNPFCLHKLCPRIRAKYLKISNLDAFPQILVFFFSFSLSQKLLQRTVQGAAVQACQGRSSHTLVLTSHQVTEVLAKHIRHKLSVPQPPACGQFSP